MTDKEDKRKADSSCETLKENLKRNATECALCGKTFSNKDVKYCKTLDYRESQKNNEASYAILCSDCNYKMYKAEEELARRTAEHIANTFNIIKPEIAKLITIIAEDEADAIISYSKGIHSSHRTSLDKLYCGIHRWKTDEDLILLSALAEKLGLMRVDSKHIAKEKRKK